MPRARLAAIVVAISAALAGCGSENEEKNDYVDQVNAVTSTLNSGLTEVTTEATAISSPTEANRVFSSFASSLDAAAREISEISPPDDVADLHDRLMKQVQGLAAEATDAANEVKAGGPAAVAGVSGEFLGEATRVSDEIDTTITAINSDLQG